MGYTTKFTGRFTITPRLTMEQFAELSALEEWPGAGRARGGYMQWKPTKDGNGLEWDGNEKFYEYVECLEWLIITKFKPWGRILSGSVTYQGESRDDRGTVTVGSNVVVKTPTGLFAAGATLLETAINALREIVADHGRGDDNACEIARAALKLIEPKK